MLSPSMAEPPGLLSLKVTSPRTTASSAAKSFAVTPKSESSAYKYRSVTAINPADQRRRVVGHHAVPNLLPAAVELVADRAVPVVRGLALSSRRLMPGRPRRGCQALGEERAESSQRGRIELGRRRL